jgi:hypothetical protein
MSRPSLHVLVLATALLIAGASGVGLSTAPAAAAGMSPRGVAAPVAPTHACRALEQHRAAIGHERPL